MKHVKLFEGFLQEYNHAPETSNYSRLSAITKDDIKKEFDKIKDPKVSFEDFLEEVNGLIKYKKSNLSDIDPIRSEDFSAKFYDSTGDTEDCDAILKAINSLL